VLCLQAPAYTVSFDLVNTGVRDGTEVAQVYVAFPLLEGEPPAVLRGFADVELKKGESKRVVVTLSRHALSV
jgi:beta-glucosidase